MPAPPPTRIYVVETIKTREEALVRAARAGSAKQFVSGNDYTVRVASQRDLERLLRDGVPVQEAYPDKDDESHEHTTGASNGQGRLPLDPVTAAGEPDGVL